MYFSILHNQERNGGAVGSPPATQHFETDDMISLIRHLHLSEHVQQQRWFNAMIGRVFLALYKTPQLEHLIRSKMNKKMARVSKPAFITSLKLGDLDLGHSAPSFSNMKLRECTVDGDVTVELDVRYNGHMKIVVAAVARIELGSRLKPREVNLVLATTLKMLDGHLLLRIKPPPSNRLWFSFETMPKMDLSIEPILSSRQITYTVVTRAIESRLKEVLAETLVSPFWDDIPFSSTEGQTFRGGIWQPDEKSTPEGDEQGPALASRSQTSPSLAGVDLLGSESSHDGDGFENVPALPSRAVTMPVDHQSDDLVAASVDNLLKDDAPGTPSSMESAPASLATQQTHTQRRLDEKPRALRASSFTTAASPVVSSNSARVSSPQNQLRRRQAHPDATSAMKLLSSQSPDTSPTGSPVGSASQETFFSKTRSNSLEHTATSTNAHRRSSSGPVNFTTASNSMDFGGAGHQKLAEIDETGASHRTRKSALTAALAAKSSTEQPGESRDEHRAILSTERKAAINQSVNSAAAAAKNWGLGVLQRQMEARSTPDKSPLSAKTMRNPAEPMGRGQPLPPPGQPLPKPKPDTWSSMAMNSLRRKPVAPAGGGHIRKESLQSNPDSLADSLSQSESASEVESRKESVQSLPEISAVSSSAELRKESLQSSPDVVGIPNRAKSRKESLQSLADSTTSSPASRTASVSSSRPPKASQTSMDAVSAAVSSLSHTQQATGESAIDAQAVTADSKKDMDVDEDVLPTPSPPAPTLARNESGGS